MKVMINNKEAKEKIICPDCGGPIPFSGKLERGDIFECPHCATEVEVVSLDPLRIEIIEEEK